jgi:hypothetical protein
VIYAVADIAATESVRPGATGTEWLLATVSRLQSEDPLRPVTVIVPSYQAGKGAST